MLNNLLDKVVLFVFECITTRGKKNGTPAVKFWEYGPVTAMETVGGTVRGFAIKTGRNLSIVFRSNPPAYLPRIAIR